MNYPPETPTPQDAADDKQYGILQGLSQMAFYGVKVAELTIDEFSFRAMFGEGEIAYFNGPFGRVAISYE